MQYVDLYTCYFHVDCAELIKQKIQRPEIPLLNGVFLIIEINLPVIILLAGNKCSMLVKHH